MEKRFNQNASIGIQTREIGDGENKESVKILSGYAAVFDSLSENLGGFKEKIAKGAFTKTLQNSQDVRCLFGHNTMHVIGRQSAGTLTLSEDDKGLYFEVLPDTSISWVSDLIKSIERGDITGCSFGFNIVSDEKVGDIDGLAIYQLNEVELYEVSPVAFPAYPETSVRERREHELQKENEKKLENEKRKLAFYEKRLRLLKLRNK